MTEGCSARVTRTGFAAFIIAALCMGLTVSTHAGPANDAPFTLQQPDGTSFQARQFGDEWMNGTETIDGYTIIKDARSGYWSYAGITQAGALSPSPFVVGRDLPSALARGVRPPVSAERPPAHARANPGPFVGTTPMLAILVDFADEPATTTAAQWARRFFGSSDSVRTFFGAASYETLDIHGAAESHGTADDGVVGWLRLDGRHPRLGGTVGAGAQSLARRAMTAASENVAFAAYDTDGDGTLSERELLVIVVVAGSETSFAAGCSAGVWAHTWALEAPLPVDGVHLQSYAMLGEKHCSPARAATPATVGTIAHETGHLMGLPDLYDTDHSSAGVGRWSVMGSGGWDARGPAVDAWSKSTMGWLTPRLVSGTLPHQPIRDAAEFPDVFRFGSSTEYFLVENRDGGLLIWHVDDARMTNEEECPCTPSAHPRVRLVADPFPGTAPPYRRAFTSTSLPNSMLYSGAGSGMSVTEISDGGPVMTATLSAGTPTAASLAPSANLAVGSVSTVASAAPGATIAVTEEVVNYPWGAGAAAGTSTVGLYLVGSGLGPGVEVLLGTRTVPPLAVWARSTGVTNVTLPLRLPRGYYTIMARADIGNVIDDVDRSNNTASSRRMMIGRDLTVTFASTVRKATPGQTINVESTVRNSGSVKVGAFTVGFYLSSNRALEGRDLLLATRTVRSLAAGASISVPATVTIPANATPATYFIFVRADDGRTFREGDEENNDWRTDGIAIGPDLAVSIGPIPRREFPDDPVVLTYTVTNKGLAPAPAFTVGLDLAQTGRYRPDVLLASRIVGPLAAGASSSEEISLPIPPDTPADLYHILVRADVTGAIREAVETNNVSVSSDFYFYPRCTTFIKVDWTQFSYLSAPAPTVRPCPTLRPGPGYQSVRYSFGGRAGQQVAVIATSVNFDTYLYLINPDGTYVEDDNGGGGTNSRIPAGTGLITLPVTGTYIIEAATATPGGYGALRVTLTNRTAPLPSAGAIPLRRD